MIQIKEKFQNLIPRLEDEEYGLLKESILQYGCKQKIILWKDFIIDGHNRYSICIENNIPFETETMEFETESDVIVWIIKNQLGRRNLNEFASNNLAIQYKAILREKAKENKVNGIKKARANNPKVTISDFVDINKNSNPANTRKEMAKMAGTSEDSIRKTEKILKAHDNGIIPEKDIEDLKQGKVKVNTIYKKTIPEKIPEVKEIDKTNINKIILEMVSLKTELDCQFIEFRDMILISKKDYDIDIIDSFEKVLESFQSKYNKLSYEIGL